MVNIDPVLLSLIAAQINVFNYHLAVSACFLQTLSLPSSLVSVSISTTSSPTFGLWDCFHMAVKERKCKLGVFFHTAG